MKNTKLIWMTIEKRRGGHVPEVFRDNEGQRPLPRLTADGHAKVNALWPLISDL